MTALATGFNCFNFRGTIGFVTDDPADVACLGSTTPVVLPGPIGLTAYLSPTSGGGTDFNAALDPRIAGCQPNTGSRFIDIAGFTPGHTYEMRGAWGYDGVDIGCGFQLCQGADLGGVNITDVGTTVEGSHLLDATGFEHLTYAAWLAAQGGNTLTFTPTGTIVSLFRNAAGQGNYIRCLAFRDPSAGGGTGNGKLTLLGCS